MMSEKKRKPPKLTLGSDIPQEATDSPGDGGLITVGDTTTE